jgi:SH3 domain-containing YSC84-like protein 1
VQILLLVGIAFLLLRDFFMISPKGNGMKKIICLSLLLTIVTVFNLPAAYADMRDDVNQAISIFERFQEMPERSIPKAVLRDAKGLAILTVVKAGFIFSGRGGSGVVVARTKKGWSSPSAIGTGGAGFGLQIGAEVSEFVIVLNTNEAVRAFSQGGNVQLGADVSVAAGPVGRTAEAGITPMAAVYTYSRSQGIFAGVSLEGTVIATRDEANAKYYHRPVSPRDILSGHVQPPPEAKALQKVLNRY